MKFIAHRGNLIGPTTYENAPSYINEAIQEGFDVEIDVWYLDGELYLGHDAPTHKIDLNFLQQQEVWAHAKNLPALELMLDNNVHCFWHENDQRVLTSRGYVWTFPNMECCPKSVLVVLDKELGIKNNIYGVCGDYVSQWS